MSDRRLAIMAEGYLEFHHGKTAVSLLRYRPEEVVAVIDSENAGRSTDDVLGLGGNIPVVGTIQDAMAYQPTALLIGIAPRGGQLPPEWRGQILYAIDQGLDIISGLHHMLGEDAEFAAAAQRSGSTLDDVRRAPENLTVAELKPRRPGSRVITFVGSDCAIGKMTAALEVTAAAQKQGLSTAFVATGQTGIMIEGTGIAIDHVISDYTAGATEEMVLDAAERADWVFVEGQGSLLHPGYSGVTLGLIHGSAPDGMILVHRPGQTHIEGYPVPIPPLDQVVKIYEDAAGWVRRAPVVGIALNTRELDKEVTRRAIAEAEALTGLPATDPVKYGGEKLVSATVNALSGAATAQR